MSLDIGIGDGISPAPLAGEPSLHLDDDDGYYWFLHPLIEELARATGQYIDLYDDASFSNENLDALQLMLAKAKQLVDEQGSSWDVCIHQVLVPYNKKTRERPHLKPVFSKVEKHTFSQLLIRWEQVVARAKELGQPLVCFGD